MNANPILLQKKYADVISCFARKENISLDQAMDIFYRSEVYRLIREGVSDMHCMSREYLAEELDETNLNSDLTELSGGNPGVLLI